MKSTGISCGRHEHSDVIAAAPVMPMKLIAPRDVQAAGAQPAATEVAWGVKAVRRRHLVVHGNGVVVAVLDTGIDKTIRLLQVYRSRKKTSAEKATAITMATEPTAPAQSSAGQRHPGVSGSPQV